MSDDNDKRKKKSTAEKVEAGWARWRSPIRQCVYELVYGYAISLAFGLPLALGSSFFGLLSTGLVIASLGAVLSLGIGVVGNPLSILLLAIIHLIDGDLKETDSKGWFFAKSVLKALLSGTGAFLAGLSLRALFGALLAPALLPANVLPGTDFATGITVWFVAVFYYHVVIFLSIHTDDGYGMILLAGLAQLVMGFLTFAIWQYVPNLNYLFLIVTAVAQWNTFAWWVLLVELGAIILVLGLYYLFFIDVFSMKNRMDQQASNFIDEASALMDRDEQGAARSATKSSKNW